MAAYHVLWRLDKCYGNATQVLPCVISNYRMKQSSHTACVLSTPFFQSSSPPPLPSPPSGILLWDYSFMSCTLYTTAQCRRSQIHRYQRSQILPYQCASNESRFTATCEVSFTPASEAGSTATSEASFTSSSKAGSTATSLLPAKPVSPLPAKPDPPVPACSRWSQFPPYQQSRIHLHQLTPSEASFTPSSDAGSTATSFLPAKSDCQRGKLLPAKPVSPLPAK